MLTRVKCPLHGRRFKPLYRIFVAKWLRAKQPQHLWTHHSEQYRKAWFASFPPDLWPAEEEEGPSGRIFLKLKDGTRLLASEKALQATFAPRVDIFYPRNFGCFEKNRLFQHPRDLSTTNLPRT
jgi:hypothetical protein